MRDLKIDELSHVYGAGGNSRNGCCYSKPKSCKQKSSKRKHKSSKKYC